MTGASDEPGSGQLSGWLSKKKSGSAVLRMRQYNKRFFVLDFQAREFSYAHAEGSKKSSVVPFSDLVEVRQGGLRGCWVARTPRATRAAQPSYTGRPRATCATQTKLEAKGIALVPRYLLVLHG